MKEFHTLSRIEQSAFPGARVSYGEPPALFNASTLWMMTHDGDWISGLFAPGTGTTDLAVIHFYGNAENLRTAEFMIEAIRSLGPAVLCFDYRGYGASGGRPSERSFYADAEFAFDWIAEHHPNLRPVVCGRAVGAAVATHLATVRPTQGLVLFSPPTNLVDVVRHVFPPDEIIIEEALPFRFDTLSRVPRVRCPIFIAHGRRDLVVPYRMGRVLESAATRPVTWFDAGRAGHDNLFSRSGEALWDRLTDFLHEL